MNITKLERRQLIDQRGEERRRVADPGVLIIRDRREADAGAISPDGGGDGSGRLNHEADAVFGRTAIRIGALVGGIAEELVQQITIGGVQLDPIKPGRNGILRRRHKFGGEPRQLGQLKRARRVGRDA